MNVFDLMAKLSLDKSEYSSGMEDASKEGESTASKLGTTLNKAKKVAGATLASLGAVATATTKKTVDAMKETAEYGDVIDKTSQKLGVSAKTYQEYDYIMNLAGTSMQDMTVGMKTLTNQLDSAIGGGKEATENFQKLGFSMEELKTMSREDLFKKTIERLQQMEDTTERASLANDLFGKSGQNLTPLFNMTNEETQELIGNLNAMGGVMSDESVKASAQFQDSLTTLGVAFNSLRNGAMAKMLPEASKVMDGLTKLFSGDDSGIGMVTEGISNIADMILENLPKFVDTAMQIVKALGQAIIDNLPQLMESAVMIVTSLIDMLVENLPMLIEMAPEILIAIGKGIVKAIPKLAESVAKTIVALVDMFMKALSKFTDIGKNLVSGLWNGIKSAWSNLLSKFTDLCKGLINKIKGIFGIHSPSKVFAQIGEYCAEGFNEGIDDMMDADAITSNLNKGISKIKNGIDIDTSGTITTSMSGDASNESIAEYCRKTLEIISQYLPQFANMQMVTDTGLLVGALAPQMDEQLGIIAQRKARG